MAPEDYNIILKTNFSKTRPSPPPPPPPPPNHSLCQLFHSDAHNPANNGTHGQGWYEEPTWDLDTEREHSHHTLEDQR